MLDRLRTNIAMFGVAMRRVGAEYGEIAKIRDNGQRSYAVLVYLTPMQGSERQAYIAAMKGQTPHVPEGHTIGLALPRPRRDCMTQYCEVRCWSATQALQITLAVVTAALYDVALNPDELRAEVAHIQADGLDES